MPSCFFLLSLILEPIIRFSEIKYSIREPQVKGDVAVVKIPILRLGDTSKVSVVRVHTKDGSATSGDDYHPLSRGKQPDLVTSTGPLQNGTACVANRFTTVCQMLSSKRATSNTP